MKRLIPCIALLLFFSACDTDVNPNEPAISQGKYQGTFQRTGMSTSNVELNLTDINFEGTSSVLKYPAICHGSYTFTNSTISFEDSCSWTADFDWTLILDGTYNFTRLSERELRIWRTNGSITDEYLLIRMTR